LVIFIGRCGEAQVPAPPRALPQPRSAAQVKLAQCTAAGGDTPAAVRLLRPLLAEHEAQFADLFVEIGNFLFDRGEPEEARRPAAGLRPGLQHHGDVLCACAQSGVSAAGLSRNIPKSSSKVVP